MAASPPVHTWQALPEMWPYLDATHGTLMAVEEPHRKPAVSCTYTQLAQEIRQFAAGLSHLGLKPGKHIALFADNSSRWLVADQGTMLAGLVNVVRGTQAPPAELDYIYRHSESVALIAEDQATLRTLQPYLKDWSLRAIILLFGDELDTVLEVPAPVLTLEQVLRMGQGATWTPPPLGRGDLATLLYTSGTTGRPKGVMLSHGNLLHQVENLHVVLTPQPGYVALSLLPTWHTYERSSEYYLFSRGIRQVYTNLRSFKQDLKRYQPHHIVGVPRLWESIYEGIERELRQQPAGRQKLINVLLSQSRRHILARRQWQGTALETGSRFTAGISMLLTWPFQILADRLIYGKVRQAVGGRLCEGASGGGALSRHLDDFYEMAGVAIVVGYGLTETSPVLTARRVKPNIRYTAGRPIPGTEIRIVDPETRQTLPMGQKGLVLARGPQVMLGYYCNPEATAKVLDPEGWFDTGDLGWLTPRQDLVLTGRAKDTIVLTSGENIEPQPIEDACSQSPFIAQIMLVGQDQRQLGALIVPQWSALEDWAVQGGQTFSRPQETSTPGTPLSIASPEVVALYRQELKTWSQQRANVRPYEQIGPFRLLEEPFSLENGLLTQTLKVKRNVVMERYQAMINEMFS